MEGRPVDIDIDDGEEFIIPITGPAILEDPMKPRVKGFDIAKKQDRF